MNKMNNGKVIYIESADLSVTLCPECSDDTLLLFKVIEEGHAVCPHLVDEIK